MNTLNNAARVTSFILRADTSITIGAYGYTSTDVNLDNKGYSTATYGVICGYTVLCSLNNNVAVHIVSRAGNTFTFKIVNLTSASQNSGQIVAIFCCVFPTA